MAIAGVVALVMTSSGCAENPQDDTSTSAGAATAESIHRRLTPPAPALKCQRAVALKTTDTTLRAPKQMLRGVDELTAMVRTNCGSFSIALNAKRFPTTVNSFVFLATRGFYDGIPFDEAGAGRYLHGGDPPGKADGPGYVVAGKVPFTAVYRHGMVVMSQPGEPPRGQAGSQFFIVLAKPWLDFIGIYPPLGTVKKGFGVLNAISRLGPHARYHSNIGVLGPVGKLRHPVVIEKISIEKE